MSFAQTLLIMVITITAYHYLELADPLDELAVKLRVPWKSPKRSLGQHLTLELFGCNADSLSRLDDVTQVCRDTVKAINATEVSSVGHQFEPVGATVLILLSESHLSIHTWPEHGYAAVDVFTCGDQTQPLVARAFMEEKFGCDSKLTIGSYTKRGGLSHHL